MQEIKEAITAACKNLFNQEVEPDITRPDEQFGDYTTNAALQLASKLNKNPRAIAQEISANLQDVPEIAKVEIAGPGFINFTLTDEALARAAMNATRLPRTYEGQEILVEFGDPNPFKEMHIGHLYSYIIGDGISRLLEADGANVRRLSYHGDVGLHVAKTIWGMRHSGVNPESPGTSVQESIGSYYVIGNKAYEEDDSAKAEIKIINEQVYKGNEAWINELYAWGRRASFEYFDELLDELGIKTDRRYLESESAAAGEKYVRENIGPVFKESDGAIIYEGEKAGLHTRVFLTSQGLPTYEAKDLGLAELKARDYPNATRSIIITAHEQAEYFKVMLAALAEIDPESSKKTSHLTHGFLSLSTGKMSSRTGNVYSAARLIKEVKDAAAKQYPDSNPGAHTAIAALKYTFLKHRVGTDIIFNVRESVGMEGNSGPYIQYAHARACSILARTSGHRSVEIENFDGGERSLARKISEYPDAIARASAELLPSHVTSYLYELAQSFNRFYENNRVIGDEREAPRLSLVKAYADVLANGLNILGIEAPERM